MYPSHLRGVPPTPALVPKTPLPDSTTSARAYGPGLTAAEVGCATSFTVESLDPYNERRRMGGDVVVARLMVGSDVTVEAFTLDNTDGTFACTYVPKSVDARQKLHVTVNGIPIRGSPFRPGFTAGPVAAKACTASGASLYDSVAGLPTTIEVQARDCFGNPRRVGGDVFKLHVRAAEPNRAEYREVFRSFAASEGATAFSTDIGGGAYALTWSADVPGGYDLHVTLDRTPIRGSPFRCYLASKFARPPLAVATSLVECSERAATAPSGRPAKSREVAPPEPAAQPAAAMVDGQLVVLSTARSTPKAAQRWPSAHACQFAVQYMHENAYLSQATPPCRWRSCLLPTHALEARHTLVGGAYALYVLTQSAGTLNAIDAVACTEVAGGGAWRPPQTFVRLRSSGRAPAAVEGFVALHTSPVGDARPFPTPEGDGGGSGGGGGGSGGGGGGGGGEGGEGEGEEANAPPPSFTLPDCLWVVGGLGPDGSPTLMDVYNVEEVWAWIDRVHPLNPSIEPTEPEGAPAQYVIGCPIAIVVLPGAVDGGPTRVRRRRRAPVPFLQWRRHDGAYRRWRAATVVGLRRAERERRVQRVVELRRGEPDVAAARGPRRAAATMRAPLPHTRARPVPTRIRRPRRRWCAAGRDASLRFADEHLEHARAAAEHAASRTPRRLCLGRPLPFRRDRRS